MFNPGVQTFNHVGGVDVTANFFGIMEEGEVVLFFTFQFACQGRVAMRFQDLNEVSKLSGPSSIS